MKTGLGIAVAVTLILLLLFGLPVSAEARGPQVGTLTFVSANGPPWGTNTYGETAQFTLRLREKRPNVFHHVQIATVCDDGPFAGHAIASEATWVGPYVDWPLTAAYFGSVCHAYVFTDSSERPSSNIVDFAG